MSRRSSIALAVLVLAASCLPAEVRIVRLPDGSRVMHNRGSGTPRTAAATPGRRDGDLRQTVERTAQRHRLDPRLVDAVIRVESAYDPGALSHKGAMGLMQLMPGTARELAVGDPYDPEQNIEGGAAYLRAMMDRFNQDLELSLAAYNAGPEAVATYGGLPPFPETRRYVQKVMAAYRGEPSYRLRSAGITGRPTYLYRDAAGRLVLTTTPPSRP